MRVLEVLEATSSPRGDGENRFLPLVEGGEINVAVGNWASIDTNVRWDGFQKCCVGFPEGLRAAGISRG